MSERNRTNYAFDHFQIDAQKRLLLCDGQPVQLTSKAFDLLIALIESGGREITKGELFERVWPNQMIEDANLTVTMSHLRKALGEKAGERRFIVTIPGRGYRFIAELQSREGFIIERHSVSQIVIEEETENERESAFAHIAETKMLLQENGFASNADVALAAVSAVKAFPEPKIKSFRGRRFTLFLSGALILVLLLAGGFALWRYKSQQNNQSRSARIPFSQMTIKQLTAKGNINWAIISPNGKFYAYTLNDKGDFKISLWLAQIEDSNEIQIRPPEEALYRGLAFSSDSKTLYFSLNAKDQSEQGALYRMPVLGGAAEKILSDVGAFLSLSPDDRQIAFFRANEDKNSSSLVIVNLDGTGEREALSRPLDRAFSSNAPAWSPDGSMLAVGALDEQKREEVFIVQVQDGAIKQLTALAWRDIVNLVWQRDGQGLIAVAKEKGATDNQLWQIDYPSGDARRISLDVDTYGFPLSLSADSNLLLATQGRTESNIWVAPADNLAQARQVTFSSIGADYGWYGLDWSPDGKILFTGTKDQSRVIYEMDPDGGNLKQITPAGFNDQKMSVTADGRFIVFQSNRSRNTEIWRANSDGSDLKQLTTGGGNSSPDTTPDGRWVVYVSVRESKSSIWRIPLTGGEPLRVTDKDSFTPRVSPDGKLIACAYKAAESGPWQIALVPIEGGAPVKLFDLPRSANLSLRWTPDGKVVCYRDWVNGIWKQDVNGGPPQRLPGLPEDAVLPFGWSRDGKLFAFTRGRTISDAVLIKNFN
jgi:Tol biopolymer transport system component/DNA-binding winged helix-turn-helix (wHTH) protein